MEHFNPSFPFVWHQGTGASTPESARSAPFLVVTPHPKVAFSPASGMWSIFLATPVFLCSPSFINLASCMQGLQWSGTWSLQSLLCLLPVSTVRQNEYSSRCKFLPEPLYLSVADSEDLNLGKGGGRHPWGREKGHYLWKTGYSTNTSILCHPKHAVLFFCVFMWLGGETAFTGNLPSISFFRLTGSSKKP